MHAPKKVYKEIDAVISMANLKDQVAALLYGLNYAHDSEDILDVVFHWSKINKNSDSIEVIPITVKLKSHQDVEVIKH